MSRVALRTVFGSLRISSHYFRSNAVGRAAFDCLRISSRHLHGNTVGFVGLGKIGSGMAGNLASAGATVIVFDPQPEVVASLVSSHGVRAAKSAADVAQEAKVILSAVPNDAVLRSVTQELLPVLAERSANKVVHVSCSTVSPSTLRDLAKAHAEQSVGFVSAPVFARPDGMRRGEATIPVSGPQWAKELSMSLLERTSMKIQDFGEDAGAAGVVKIGGNFLIASAIEALAESAAMAESQGVDRELFVNLLSSTIFDCLIYRGYGQRVAARDHHPYPDAHFALELGCKDVSLVCQTAAEVNCPMPFASVLREKFMASQNAGRGKLDWSAIGLRASEDAGSKTVADAIQKLTTDQKKV